MWNTYQTGARVGLPVSATDAVPVKGHMFQVYTRRYGTYTCRMTARGSDFVIARCRRGARFVRCSSMNHWFLHGH